MTTKRNMLVDACIYVGANNCLGIASSVTSPVIKHKTIDVNDLGSCGSYKLNTGKVEAMTTKITLNSFYEEIFAQIANPCEAVEIAIYGDLMEYTGDKVTSHKGVKLFIRGTSEEFGLLGELKDHENMNYDMNFNLTMARLVVGGKERYHIDIPNNIHKVNGIDVRAEINKNLGIL
ncbi:MAG: phage major tail tube protein [Candidatus Gastranaerophilales bacterium]|nr:phage major tail tube protein [Candidatus Gastranaerophilales bacterium]